MRSAVALAALGAISAAAGETLQLPASLSQIIVLIVGGGGLSWYFARDRKRLLASLNRQQEETARKSSVDRQEVLDRMQQAVLADTEARIEGLRADLHKAERDAAELKAEMARRDERHRVAIAKRDGKIALLSGRIERLSDQLLALEQGERASKRRSDPGPA